VTSFQTDRIDAATGGKPTQFIYTLTLAQVETNGPISILFLCSVGIEIAFHQCYQNLFKK
jgi:hypothetical protein